MSQGRERIIVNCGGYRGGKPAWQRVVRSSAAHSVLVVGDANAVEMGRDGAMGHMAPHLRGSTARRRGGISGSPPAMTATASGSG